MFSRQCLFLALVFSAYSGYFKNVSTFYLCASGEWTSAGLRAAEICTISILFLNRVLSIELTCAFCLLPKHTNSELYITYTRFVKSLRFPRYVGEKGKK